MDTFCARLDGYNSYKDNIDSTQLRKLNPYAKTKKYLRMREAWFRGWFEAEEVRRYK